MYPFFVFVFVFPTLESCQIDGVVFHIALEAPRPLGGCRVADDVMPLAKMLALRLVWLVVSHMRRPGLLGKLAPVSPNQILIIRLTRSLISLVGGALVPHSCLFRIFLRPSIT